MHGTEDAKLEAVFDPRPSLLQGPPASPAFIWNLRSLLDSVARPVRAMP
jgi:hypothetical protein